MAQTTELLHSSFHWTRAEPALLKEALLQSSKAAAEGEATQTAKEGAKEGRGDQGD